MSAQTLKTLPRMNYPDVHSSNLQRMTDTMTDVDNTKALPEQTAIMREMACDMSVALYRRYSVAEATKILSLSEGELESLRTQGEIAYLHINDKHIGFFGCQLLTYLLECIVPVGASPKPSQQPASQAAKPTISPEAELISVNDTLTLLGIGRTKFYDLLNKNELEYVKIGKRTLIKRASLRRFTDLQAN